MVNSGIIFQLIKLPNTGWQEKIYIYLASKCPDDCLKNCDLRWEILRNYHNLNQLHHLPPISYHNQKEIPNKEKRGKKEPDSHYTWQRTREGRVCFFQELEIVYSFREPLSVTWVSTKRLKKGVFPHCESYPFTHRSIKRLMAKTYVIQNAGKHLSYYSILEWLTKQPCTLYKAASFLSRVFAQTYKGRIC